MSLIVCTQTGTVISAYSCFLVEYDALTPEDQALLEEGSDSEIIGVAIAKGKPVLGFQLPFANVEETTSA